MPRYNYDNSNGQNRRSNEDNRGFGGGGRDERNQRYQDNRGYYERDPRDLNHEQDWRQNQRSYYNNGWNNYQNNQRFNNGDREYSGREGQYYRQNNRFERDEYQDDRWSGFGSRSNNDYQERRRGGGFRRDHYDEKNDRYQRDDGRYQERRNDAYNEGGFFDSRSREDRNYDSRNQYNRVRGRGGRGGGWRSGGWRGGRGGQRENNFANRESPLQTESFRNEENGFSRSADRRFGLEAERPNNFPQESVMHHNEDEWNIDGQGPSQSYEEPLSIAPEEPERVRHPSSCSTMSVTPIGTPIVSEAPSPITSATVTNAFKQIQLESKEGNPSVYVDPPIPKADRQDKEKVTLTSNIYQMEVRTKIVYKYDINVKILAADGKVLDLTKCANDSSSKTKRNETCVAALRAALEAYRIIREGEAILYDGAAMLFSSEDLVAELKPHSNTLTVQIHSLPENIRRRIHLVNAQDVVVEINPCASGGSFNLADYQKTHKNNDLANLDRTHQQFFDCLTNKLFLNSGRFTAFGSGRLFPRQLENGSRNIKNGQIQVSGIDKGIVFIKPKNNELVPALVIDSKMGNFFKSQSAIVTVCEFLNLKNPQASSRQPFPMKQFGNRVNNYIKGMRFTIAGRDFDRSFVASGITNVLIKDILETEIGGNKVRLLQHSRFNEFNTKCVNVNWPAIVVRGKIGNKEVKSYYPMEFLIVAENQRVSKSKQDERTVLRPMRVQERFKEIRGIVDSLNLHTSCPAQTYILQAFGVFINTQPIKVNAIRRALPDVIFSGESRVKIDRNKANFKMQKFREGARIDDIVIGYWNGAAADKIKKMKERLMRSMQEMGMKVIQFHECPAEGKDHFDVIRNVFQVTAANLERKEIGPKVLIIYAQMDDVKDKTHAYLKLFERKYLIVTQHITLHVVEALSSSGQRDTLQNVLNKMNIKMGGLNYSLKPEEYSEREWISNGKSLIIGYDVAHPTGLSRDEKMDKTPHTNASVVGISFNGAPNPESFIGDFHYQRPNEEQVNDSVLNSRVKWILDLFHKNRGQLPENIFIIRDGVSEGQIAMVKGEEFEAIKEAIEEWKVMKKDEIDGVQQWTPKFVVAVIIKRHNKRFAQEIQGRFDNPKPGTVIDDQVVRTDMTQFYIQAHKTVQGTSKMPSVQICLDELASYNGPKTQDKLQSLMMTLSCSHQISSGPVSMPEPVYQADEWAKRGNDIFKIYEEFHQALGTGEKFPRLTKWNKNKFNSAPIDFEKLTAILSYRDTLLQQFRVNA